MNIDYKTIVSDLKIEFSKRFTESKPFVKNSFLGILLNTFGYGIYQVRLKLQFLLKQTFANTANFEHLRLQAQNRIDDLPPTPSSGLFIITGTKDSIIPANTEFYRDDLLFKTLEDVTIVETLFNNMDELIYDNSNNEVRLTFKSYHELINDMRINISNATNTILNGDYDISIVDDKTISFELINSVSFSEDVRKSSRKAIIKSNMISAKIESAINGKVNNLTKYTPVTFTDSNINQCAVNYNGLSGGRDIESTELYRDRYLKFLREPQAYFNEAHVKSIILDNFPKVTRCYITSPYTNLVNIYCVNDEVNNKLVDTKTLADILTKLKSMQPINLNTTNLLITNANHTDINLTISGFKPNVKSFKDLVIEEINYYLASHRVGENIKISGLEGFIYNIKDFKNGYGVESFNLNLSNDISIGSNAIAKADIKIL